MIPFVKAHACGNDFLIIEEADARREPCGPGAAACARNTGIGADGIEFLERTSERRILPAAVQCGRQRGRAFRQRHTLRGGMAGAQRRSARGRAGHAWRRAQLPRRSSPHGALYQIESEMGVPRVMPRTIVLAGVGEVAGAMVNVGNPHFVIFVESEDFSAHGLSWQELGAKISTSPLFPHGTNVEFVQMHSQDEIAFRIYERGCGPTTSSGTGTCAASAAAMVLRGAARELTVDS